MELIKNVEIEEWIRQGRPVPPPHSFKQQILAEFSKRYSLNLLIETGTCLGEMVDAMKAVFSGIISIELSPMLYENAKAKFQAFKHILILQGDSAEVLPQILNSINIPCLFWLDGHYSGDVTAKGNLNTPIMQELSHVLNHKEKTHVILIDDARLFNGEEDYPTISELQNFVRLQCPDSSFEVEDDIIRIVCDGSRKLNV